MNTFEDRVAFLTSLGIEHILEYEYRGSPKTCHDLPIFTRVLLPFTPEEWCQLCMTEGDHYVGGCCGNMSVLQDEINSIFRDGGYVTCERLADIAESMASHEEEDTDYAFSSLGEETLEQMVDRAKNEWAAVGPWEKMAVIWHVVKDFYGPKIPSAPVKTMSEVDKAVTVLRQSLTYIQLCGIFGPPDTAEAISQEHVSDLVNLARIAPALKTLTEHLGDLNPGPFEGLALIDKTEGPDEIAVNRRGYCIFATQDEVDRMLDLWRKQEAAHAEKPAVAVDQRLGTRPVRVTMEKGIEFLD